MNYARYVAIGDSSTEGLEDPGPDGRYRGWADRLALHVAQAQGTPLEYANLAVRGRKTKEILDEQLEPALAMRPDLASIFAGTNDIIRSSYDLDSVIADLRTMHRALRATRATVITITMPDLSEIAPFAKRVRPRLLAFNDAVRALCSETGVLLLDAAKFPVACDPRLWHSDRLHANAEGHSRIGAGLAHTIGVPGFDESWAAPLPPLAPRSSAARAAAEVQWTAKYLLPWLMRRALGRSSGDGITPKRPTLQILHP
jgi:lysophospholipase L1-like esterase